jgi:hypothetical protein
MGGRYGHWIGTRIMPEMAARIFFFAACRSPIPYILGFCKRLSCFGSATPFLRDANPHFRDALPHALRRESAPPVELQ